MKYTSNALTGLKLKTNNSIRILDNQYYSHDFKDFFGKLDISTILKPHGSIFAITSVDFHSLQLGVDQSALALTGSANNSKATGIKVNLTLQLIEWKKFTAQLQQQQILSAERLLTLNNLIQAITGEDNVNNTSIKIYNSKDDSLRIGNSDVENISSYLQQLASGR